MSIFKLCSTMEVLCYCVGIYASARISGGLDD